MGTFAEAIESEALVSPVDERRRLTLHLLESIESRPASGPQASIRSAPAIGGGCISALSQARPVPPLFEKACGGEDIKANSVVYNK